MASRKDIKPVSELDSIKDGFVRVKYHDNGRSRSYLCQMRNGDGIELTVRLRPSYPAESIFSESYGRGKIGSEVFDRMRAERNLSVIESDGCVFYSRRFKEAPKTPEDARRMVQSFAEDVYSASQEVNKMVASYLRKLDSQALRIAQKRLNK